jgi:rhamnosyltransferase
MAALPVQVMWVIVDNASAPQELVPLRALAASRANSHLLECASNLGLAAALNAGARLASNANPSIEFYLLMDQDSEPAGDAVKRLLENFLHLEKQGSAVGSVGPRLVDDRTGLQHGFHCIDGWRWVRRYPQAGEPPIACANMNGSGTLVRRSLYEALGGLEEAFFIDHIDTDWAFRVIAAGYGLYGIPEAVFSHRMGESSLRFWLFGWKVWPQRSPLRHYYLFRNAIRLFARPYVPMVWKCWAVVKLVLTFTVHLIVDPHRFAQARAMFRGTKDGLKPCASPAARDTRTNETQQ